MTPPLELRDVARLVAWLQDASAPAEIREIADRLADEWLCLSEEIPGLVHAVEVFEARIAALERKG